MKKPILVVHGVATRNPEADDGFYATVRRLASDLGGEWNLIPVYWGDLGAATDFRDAIPIVSAVQTQESSDEIRGAVRALLGDDAKGGPTGPVVRSENMREDAIVDGAVTRTQGGTLVRSADEGMVRLAVHEELPRTEYLRWVSDVELLTAVGEAVGEAVAATEPAGGIEVRGSGGVSGSYGRGGSGIGPYGAGEVETRGTVRDVTRSVLRTMDKAIGRTVGRALGRVNQEIRTGLGASIASFLGDILVYQRNQEVICQRLTETISRHAPGYGSPEQPIDVLAHSLGGVISFDAATKTDDPLHIGSFVTFGSQSAFFQIVDPRGTLNRYAPGTPVQLPATIGRWISLWEPLDVLAFLTNPIFRLSSGDNPRDVLVEHRLSYGVSTHSSYWRTPELAEVLREVLR